MRKRSTRTTKQLHHRLTQPPIARFVVIPGVPMLPHGKAVHGKRTRMNRQVIDLSERLTDVSRQRSDQVGRPDDCTEPQKSRQLQHDVPLNLFT